MSQPSQSPAAPSGQPVDGGVLITLREIYVVVLALQNRVELLINQHADALDRVKDHEGRLRSLERSRWPLPAVSILIALGAVVVAILKG